MLKAAFIGYRHGHIGAAYKHMSEIPEIEIVGFCEEDAATRKELEARDDLAITHDNYEKMLAEVDCDIIAIGDYYSIRGQRAIRALETGHNVLSDKPICTSLEELDKIASLAESKGLKAGCMLDLRDNPVYITMRKLVQDGKIGEVTAISFGGQHPLMYKSGRAEWYFAEGMHCGTINDIAIHGIDLIPWMTGLKISEINSARNWNSPFIKEVPHFKDAAQIMMTLENGAGVLADVSYASPDSIGYGLPMYWRFTVWGTGGVLESAISRETVSLYKNGEKEVIEVPLEPANPQGYLKSFLAELKGEESNLTTAEIIASSRACLLTQNAADTGKTSVKI